EGLGTELMQRTARELNLSETVFLLPGEGSDEHARARIFTPTAELPFAGHPVLGTAFILAERLGVDAVRLATGAGPIAVTLRREAGTPVFGEMEQPIPSWERLDGADELLAAVGVKRSGLPVEIYDNGPCHAFVELPDEDAVAEGSAERIERVAVGGGAVIVARGEYRIE